ncbi:MAG: GNAT family N-acetyltransferase [Anaerolineales bacterium]
MNDDTRSDFSLSSLAQYPTYVDQISAWFFEEWGDGVEGRTIGQFSEVLIERMNIDKLPVAFVALASDELIGTASLIGNEISSLPRYKHWLASVFVDPEQRRKGWGTKIVRAAVHIAPDYGIDKLFLYTRSHIEFYQQLGWEYVETLQYKNRDATILGYSW